VRYFGEPYPSREYPAPMFEDGIEVPTPIGEPCLRCDEPIDEDDRGVLMPYLAADGKAHMVAFHFECHVRSTIGSVKHQRGECGCATGDFQTDDDAEYPTRREAARAALAELERLRET
jgi:hypothetical protein